MEKKAAEEVEVPKSEDGDDQPQILAQRLQKRAAAAQVRHDYDSSSLASFQCTSMYQAVTPNSIEERKEEECDQNKRRSNADVGVIRYEDTKA